MYDRCYGHRSTLDRMSVGNGDVSKINPVYMHECTGREGIPYDVVIYLLVSRVAKSDLASY